MYGFLYVTTNLINGMKYVGRRKYDRYGTWKSYLGSGRAFKKALKKYGKENFSRTIIAEYETSEELNKAEEELINNLNAVKDRNYYNLAEGGSTAHGFHMSEESKEKIKTGVKKAFTNERKKEYSDRMKLHNPNADGHTFKGRHLTEEQCKFMSEIAKLAPKRFGEDNPMYGKRGELHHGYREKSHMARKVKCIETGQIFNTLVEAGLFCGTSGSQIGLCCKGVNKTCMRYHWEYIDMPKCLLIQTEEAKEKISKSKIGKLNPQAKPVLCVETGVIYGAAYEAGRAYNICGEAISACCKGKTHTAAKMHWKYLKNDE